MADGDLTAEQLEACWAELAREKQITPEQARREYLSQAANAMTVDDQGRMVPDLLTRASARRLIAITEPTPAMPTKGRKV